MELKSLKLENFKGIKNLVLEFEGENAALYGDNATGKTTTYDAFLWLLFGKDSQGKADFDIKTVDKDGNPVSGLEHSVEAHLVHDGKGLELKKVYKEKWTKKRGAAKPEFTGHTTDHYVGGVPVVQKAYNQTIADITNEDTFKLLTNPRYFNELLPWKKRRDILMEVCGDVPDEEVLASNKDLAKLADFLGNRTMEDHRKVVAEQRKKINQRLVEIPVRIDEITKSLPELDFDPGQVEKNINAHRKAVKDAETSLKGLESGGHTVELTKQLHEVDSRIIEKKRAFEQDQEAQLKQIRQQADELTKKIDAHDETLRKGPQAKRQAEEFVSENQDKLDELRKQWKQINQEQFTGDTVCHACGQTLPEDQVEGAKERFNADKAKRLKANQEKGKRLSAETDRYQKEIERMEKQIKEAGAATDALLKKKQELAQEANDVRNVKPVLTDLEKEKADIEAKIKAAGQEEGLQSQQKKLNTTIEYNNQQIERLQATLAKKEQHETAQKRIEELTKEEEALSKKYEELLHQEYLCEQFTRAKVDMLEEKISANFKLARFKMFNEQINEGLQETCVAMHNGVPYPSMNNAARLNIGLDIINTLSEFYGFKAPVFIDNAEAVVEMLPVNAQTIHLVVSGEYKHLTLYKQEGETWKKAS